MPRRLEPSEAGAVLDLMGAVYQTHSMIQAGADNLGAAAEAGAYVSIGEFEDGELIAHAGYRVLGDFVLLNALVVDPRARGRGLGKTVFDARLSDIEAEQDVDFIVGYSMAQHTNSQRLYADDFKPIGLDIGYPDIYGASDLRYNRGAQGNAELILCKALRPEGQAHVSLNLRHHPLADSILRSVGVKGVLDNSPSHQDDLFLGFHPDGAGLWTPGFLEQHASVDFSAVATSNEERADFVAALARTYHDKQ